MGGLSEAMNVLSYIYYLVTYQIYSLILSLSLKS